MLLCVLVVCLAAAYLFTFYADNFKDKNRPPGPIRFPPFGNIVQIAFAHKSSYIALQNLARRYGDTMGIKLGNTEIVVVSSYETIKTMFSLEDTNDRECSGFFLDRNLGQNAGLVFSNGQQHSENRKFCRDALRTSDIGNRTAKEYLIVSQLNEFIRRIEEQVEGNPIGRIHVGRTFFVPLFFNIMYTIVTGTSFDYDDAEFRRLVNLHNGMSRSADTFVGVLVAFPFLRYLLPEHKLLMQGVTEFSKVAKHHLSERTKPVHHGDVRTFVDSFVTRTSPEKSNTNMISNENNFSLVFGDVLLGGTDTTSSVVNFIILQLIFNQEIQKTLYREILDIVGHDRPVCLNDRAGMIYTQAVMLEGLRWSRVATFGIPRKAKNNFAFRNYLIRKGTVLLFNLHCVFFDESIWGDPNVFRPERFINTDRKINSRKQDIIHLSFGAGKRKCFGEEIARDNVFIATVTLVQKLKFSCPIGEKPCFEPQEGVVLHPAPYNALVQRRFKTEIMPN